METSILEQNLTTYVTPILNDDKQIINYIDTVINKFKCYLNNNPLFFSLSYSNITSMKTHLLYIYLDKKVAD